MFTLNTAVETEWVDVQPNRGYQHWLAEFHLHQSPPFFSPCIYFKQLGPSDSMLFL